MRATQAEIKRDMEITRDEVRVMTVHGAKGLEAPLVILADTTTRPTGPYAPRLLAVPIGGAAPGAPEALAWAGRKETDVPALAAARAQALAAAEDEHRRLLYVAMTRAADRLIVCGYEGKQKRREGCWYDLVVRGLEASGALVALPAEEGEAPIRAFRKVERPEPAPPASAAETGPKPVVEPSWLRRPAPAEPLRPAPLAPSRAYDEATSRSARLPSAQQSAALARGRLIHRLLQSLPELPPERHAEAARRYLARAGAELDAAERERIAAECLALLCDPRFAPLFAPDSRAEAPIVGRLRGADGAPLLVSGQVDRLAVTQTAVLIADYKTNRPAPRSLDEAPPAYIAQLALYRAVLARLYPDRPVRAALVWTETPELMEISASALDRALAHLTSA
jgi:ATP-dependent helicase/nuclease subunit A